MYPKKGTALRLPPILMFAFERLRQAFHNVGRHKFWRKPQDTVAEVVNHRVPLGAN